MHTFLTVPTLLLTLLTLLSAITLLHGLALLTALTFLTLLTYFASPPQPYFIYLAYLPSLPYLVCRTFFTYLMYFTSLTLFSFPHSPLLPCLPDLPYVLSLPHLPGVIQLHRPVLQECLRPAQLNHSRIVGPSGHRPRWTQAVPDRTQSPEFEVRSTQLGIQMHSYIGSNPSRIPSGGCGRRAYSRDFSDDTGSVRESKFAMA